MILLSGVFCSPLIVRWKGRKYRTIQTDEEGSGHQYVWQWFLEKWLTEYLSKIFWILFWKLIILYTYFKCWVFSGKASHKNSVVFSLTWPSNPRSTALDPSTLTNTPPMLFEVGKSWSSICLSDLYRSYWRSTSTIHSGFYFKSDVKCKYIVCHY